MGTNGVKKVVYFFYPDPVGNQIDLRETWNGHPKYTSDGIHVDEPGNAPTAAAIFDSMVENCVAP